MHENDRSNDEQAVEEIVRQGPSGTWAVAGVATPTSPCPPAAAVTPSLDALNTTIFHFFISTCPECATSAAVVDPLGPPPMTMQSYCVGFGFM